MPVSLRGAHLFRKKKKKKQKEDMIPLSIFTSETLAFGCSCDTGDRIRRTTWKRGGKVLHNTAIVTVAVAKERERGFAPPSSPSPSSLLSPLVTLPRRRDANLP